MGTSASLTIFITFCSAAFGSFLAVALQTFVARRGSKAHFRALLTAVERENISIETNAKERSQRGMSELEIEAPYPVTAWQNLFASAEVRRLGADYNNIASFYADVELSNHRLKQVMSLLQISATSPHDEVRLEYRNLAQAFSAELQGATIQRSGGARRAVRVMLSR